MTADRDERPDASTRRGLLRAGLAVAGSLAAAGCLSNPWEPGRTRRATADGDAPASNPDTATDADGNTGDDGSDAGTSTRTTDDGASTDSDGGDTTTAGDDPTATSEPTATEIPAEEREPDLVVEVAPDGFRFSPETFEVAAGDTVHWEWKDSGHNVRVREKPDGSDWTGTPGGATDTYAEGYLHAHTFEVAGQYEYYCAPHQSLGLEGSFDVR